MAEIPQDIKFAIFGRGAKWHARVAMVLDFLGMGCLIVGIIGDAINRTPGLEPTNWLILAIALWVWGVWSWLTAYFAAKEG
jgi:hypothetical protein